MGANGVAYTITSVSLRYFNACGADPEGRIGEQHYPETHLIPIALQTALGVRPDIKIYGTDYPTPDGTCVRDYVHVHDLAHAHVLALKYLTSDGKTMTCNLGLGHGHSVQEIVNTVKNISRKNDMAVIHSARREGDPAVLVADPSLAKNILGWKPQYNLQESIRHALTWHEGDIYQNFWKNKA